MTHSLLPKAINGDTCVGFEITPMYEHPAKLIYSTVDLLELLIEGRDIVEHRKEYLEQIMKLPFVNGNGLKATEVFHRMRKLQEFLEKE